MKKTEIELKNPSLKAKKGFNERIGYATAFFESTFVGHEIRNYYPYKCVVDKTHKKICFYNRDDQLISIHEKNISEENSWLKFDMDRFKLSLFELDKVRSNDSFLVFYLYSDGSNPWKKQCYFIDFMKKVNYLESLLKDVSPFAKRFVLIVTLAYENAQNLRKLKDPFFQDRITEQYFRDLTGKLTEN